MHTHNNNNPTTQVEAPVTSLAPLLNTLGMDLPIARFMVLGCVLGVATEAVVMAASLCLPQARRR